MPEQKPGRSEQVVQTPPEFTSAVEERFGPIIADLAANVDNRVCPYHLGPGGAHADALEDHVRWRAPLAGGLSWLNPPFADIMPWAQKCAIERMRGARIALLVPASVGSMWFNHYVRPHAYVFELSPRLTFVGHGSCYPKDLILALYTPEGYLGREPWHWRRAKPANDNGVLPGQLALPLAAAETA